MTIGYIITDKWLTTPAKHTADCGGPSGLTASDRLKMSAER